MNRMHVFISQARRIVGAIACLFFAAGCKTVNVDIMIKAKPATVWKIVSNAAGHAEWNPTHVKFDGEFREGATVKMHLKDDKGKVIVVKSRILRMIPERELKQGGGFPGLFTFKHSFLLEPVEGGTRLVHYEEFRGIAVLFFNLDWIDESYRKVNQALKRRAEELERKSR